MDTRLPTHRETYKPILEALSNNKTIQRRELAHKVRDEYYGHLSDEMKKEETSTGANRLLDRILWGLVYLKQAKLVEQPQRGLYKITDKGVKLQKRGNITTEDVDKDEEFLAHSVAAKEAKNEDTVSILESESGASPQDLIDQGVKTIEEQTKTELLDKLKKVDPYEFEKVVLRLFKEMGYGETIETSKSHDGGIDGIINQDQLGLERIYIQAKRYGDSKVNEPEIRNFIGAMSGATSKGIFVTTSRFDDRAERKANGANIILVDGAKLVDLMYRYGVGVQVRDSYKVKEVDEDFFERIS